MNVPFGDLRRQYLSIKDEIDSAARRVLERGWFVLGSEVEAFEREFADYLGVRNVVGVGSGTEAIHLALLAARVKRGDEVILPANTCVPTISAVSFAGATPVLADVDPVSFNLDPNQLESLINARTRAIVPVHLYGQAADLDPIFAAARSKGVNVIEDTAQGHGALYKGKKLGTLGESGCFSFYPSKNLGCYGDGGAVATDNDELAGLLRKLRNYGEERRYYHSIKGFNSRLDEFQAAVLRVKLAHLDAWNERRRQIASIYNAGISNPLIEKPAEMPDAHHVYHLYVVRCDRRDELQRHLSERGVGALIHYPIPIHLQEAYADLGKHRGNYPVAERCCDEVLSLPIYPELTDAESEYVVDCVNEFK